MISCDCPGVGVPLQLLKNKLLEEKKNIQPTTIVEAAITMTARSHQYKFFDRHDHHWYRDYDHTETDWDYQPSVIRSIGGNNVVQSQHGSIDATATDFIAPGQTSLIALGKDVVLRELMLNHQDFRSSSNIITESSSTQYDAYGRPSRIVSIAGVYIYALNDVRAEGAQIISAGKVELKAGHDVIVSTPILDHSATSEYLSTTIQTQTCPPISLVAVYDDAKALFSTPAFRSYQGGTPTNSGRSTAGTMTNIWNLSIDSLNAFSGIMSGLRAGLPLSAIFPASSMVVAKITVSDTRSETHWQTVDPSAGIFCTSLDVRADNKVEFKNGVSIEVLEDAHIQAPQFIQKGAALSTTTETQTFGVSLGISASGDPVVGAQYSESSGSGVSYANQHLQVGGKLTVEAKEWNMQDADVTAGTLDGHVDRLTITSDCSTFKSRGISLTADTEWNVSGQYNQSDIAEINEVSEITTQDSTFTIGTAELTGARFVVTGKNKTQVDHLITHTVEEHREGSTSGLCLNLQDLGGQGNRPFAQAIPSATLNYGRGDFRAEQLSVFTGATPQDGLDSSGGDGYHVTHDSQYNLSVRVPFYNEDGLKQLEDNFQYTKHMLAPDFQPQTNTVRDSKIISLPHTSGTSSSTLTDESDTTKAPATETLPVAQEQREMKASSFDHSEENVVEETEQTLAEIDEITHQPLTFYGHSQSVPTGLRRFGMWGEKAVYDMQKRAEEEAQIQKIPGQLAPGVTGIWDRSEMGNNQVKSIGFMSGLTDHVSGAYHSGLDLSAAFLDRSSSVTKDSSVHYREMEERFKGGREISRTPASGFTQWEGEVEEGLEHKAMIRTTASVLTKLGGVGLEVIKGEREINEAKAGEKMRTTELVGAELTGEIIGSKLCENSAALLAKELAPESMGVSLLLIPAAMVGCGAATGYIARSIMEQRLDTSDKQSHSSSSLILRQGQR